MLVDIIGEYSIVAKVNVSNLESSLAWYVSNLELQHQPAFDVPNWWVQACFPDNPLIAIGLNYDPSKVGTGGAITTFVVDDIAAAKSALENKGISVSPISAVPTGVRLATFQDPDGNMLGLRQNPPNQPTVASVKRR